MYVWDRDREWGEGGAISGDMVCEWMVREIEDV